MTLSDVAKSIGESVTLRLNQEAAALRAQGEPVIHLGGGEPKGKAPREAIEAAIEILETAEIRYAPAGGILPLKEAIVRYTARFYGREVSPANVIVSGGAKQALAVALQAVVDPGDEVIFPVPYWVSYPAMVRLAGGVPVPVAASDGALVPSLADIEAAMTPRTRAILVNSPNNPSGVVYPEELVAGLVELCERRDAWLITDDIYQRLVFGGKDVPAAWGFTDRDVEDSRVVVVNGVSKQYAMTGFRIGWAVGNRELIAAMTRIQGHQTSGTSIVMQKAAAAALDGDQRVVTELRETLEENRRVLLDALATIDGVRVTPPDGTFYCFADFRKYDEDSTRLAGFLLDRVRVVTVPGVDFGMDGHLRISFCGGADEIAEGIARIRWALDPAAPRELVLGDRTLVRDQE